jgi:MinD-like ATPase involved in chromosome partitioning or flagellar assembly
MKAILYKRDDNFYSLKVDGIVMATSNGMLVDYNLSKQNCDDIFGVVDVNSEVEDIVKTICPDDRGKNIIYGTGMAVGIQCFNKAMGLIGDKKFTLEDMMNCWNKALKFQEHKETLGEFIQSLQQPTEIEVEIDMSNIYAVPEPKIDSEGCLILKRL